MHKLAQTFAINSGDKGRAWKLQGFRYNTGSITIQLKHDVPHHTGKCDSIGGYNNELVQVLLKRLR